MNQNDNTPRFVTDNAPGNNATTDYAVAPDAWLRGDARTNRKERRAARSKKGRSKHWPWRVR